MLQHLSESTHHTYKILFHFASPAKLYIYREYLACSSTSFLYQSSPAPLYSLSMILFQSFLLFWLKFCFPLPLFSSFNCKALSSYKSLMVMSHRTQSIFMYSCCHWGLKTERIGSFWQSITALMDTVMCHIKQTCWRSEIKRRLRKRQQNRREFFFDIHMYL